VHHGVVRDLFQVRSTIQSRRTAVVSGFQEIVAISVAWRDQAQSALEFSFVCAGEAADTPASLWRQNSVSQID
jgi:hypothetical protein